MTESRPPDGTGDPGLADTVRSLWWYHTIELAPGVVTPGWFDCRPVVGRLPMPASLAGMRCLDVGTFDGFWAFEMERRGAAEVVAVDELDAERWDWPVNHSPDAVAAMRERKERGRGFEVAAKALASGVRRVEANVYDLSPDELGTFDFVYLGSLLPHLRDPIRALAVVRRLCRGRLLVVDAVDLRLSLLHPRAPVASLHGVEQPWWWYVNTAGLARMLESAGWRRVGAPVRFCMPRGAGQPRPAMGPRDLLRPGAWEKAVVTMRGAPHRAITARPGPAAASPVDAGA